MNRLTGIGHCVWDQLLLVPRYPAIDSKNLAQGRAEGGGGPVPTALVAAARQGVPCRFLGLVGEDATGRAILHELEREGIDVSACRVLPGQASPLASIWIEQGSGKRTVVLDRGALPPLTEQDLPPLDWQAGELLLLDGKDPICLPAARAARAAGARVLLDLGSERANVDELLAECDLLIASKAWLMSYLPDQDLFRAVASLHERGPACVAVTLGAGGLVQGERGTKAGWFPAWPGTKVVDSTGAGDVFHGVFAWALLAGQPWLQALKAATVAGGMACSALGGRAAIPDPKALQAAVSAWQTPGI